MNRFLLEKVRYLLSNAQLDKLFSVKNLECASHLMNRVPPTVIGSKTPLIFDQVELLKTMICCRY